VEKHFPILTSKYSRRVISRPHRTAIRSIGPPVNLGLAQKTMAYYRVDVLSIDELGRIFIKLAGWSTGKVQAKDCY
jgi:hypothetical protein